MQIKSFILAVVLTVPLYSQAISPSGNLSQNQINAAKSADQSRQTDQQITIKSPVIVQLDKSVTSKEEAEQIAADREEKITYDRKTIALTTAYVDATYWLVALGVATVITYAAQCILLFFTLRYSIRGANANVVSANAAKDALQIQTTQRRQGSVFWIAERFEKQAGAWADRSWQIDDKQVEIHNTVIRALSPYMDHIRNEYPKRFEATKEGWTLFHGGEPGRVIAAETYLIDQRFNKKDFWVNQLFIIAAKLRAIEPNEGAP